MEINPTIDDAVKIVTVGDALVGKSCAITKYHLLTQIRDLSCTHRKNLHHLLELKSSHQH